MDDGGSVSDAATKMGINSVEEMVDWCSNNISVVRYYIPSAMGVRRGGVGWSMRISGQFTEIDIDDKPMLTMFLLRFGHYKVTAKGPSSVDF